MKKNFVIVCLLILGLSGIAYAKGKPGSGTCVDIPISWEFLGDGTGPEAILSDGLGLYIEGQNGITNSVIHGVGTCAGAFQASKDATLAFKSNSSRRVRIKFGEHVADSILTGGPVDFENQDFLIKGPMNIRNIIGWPNVTNTGVPVVYYTKASGGFASPFSSPNSSSYQWGALPDDATCPGAGVPYDCVENFTVVPLVSNFNLPAETAWVKVTYMPRDLGQNWTLSNTDKWLVEGTYTSDSDPILQRVTFLLEGVHQGQYSLPFRVLITARAPLPQ